MPGKNRIIRGVGEHGEALGDQGGRRLKGGHGVGEKGALVAEHLELDQVRLQQFPAQAGVAAGILGRVAAGRIRQERVFRAVEVPDEALLGILEVGPANGHRDHLAA